MQKNSDIPNPQFMVLSL